MSSPVKIPFKSLIVLSKQGNTPIYLQIARQLINAIQRGVLITDTRLPGSRALSEDLGVHRKTVIAAYDELYTQGWTQSIPNKGTFIRNRLNNDLPDPIKYDSDYLASYPKKTGFSFKQRILLDRPIALSTCHLAFSDGLPDTRIAPLDRLAKIYGGVLRRKTSVRHLGYSHLEGNEYYRDSLAYYLNNSRGLPIKKENILTTRGIHMGIYLASSVLINTGERVVVGNLSYYIANMIFQQAGAKLHAVPVDKEGISVEAIRALCEKETIRMVYITPHHHYPTTVTLSAERRIELLNLASKYGFIILEDDYDYDFHYTSSPVLPLASADSQGMVVYIGSFCKTLAPGLRTGYIIAPQNLIEEIGRFRRIVDRQSDMLMEQALGELLTEGEIHRHLKKAIKVYEQRCTHLSTLLKNELSDYTSFKSPPGGLALWSLWKKELNLMRISKNCAKYGLHLPQTLLYQNELTTAMRLGFGDLNTNELTEAVHILKQSVTESL
ncbi:PLP-dependent aminotransferase family protein [Olivibacter sp. LS-1]|jgi:GntR family transcriptional regulator/MocR family aminotransferase|nr:PLP-dependent aminotransferase family protein [Olivibacter sp. 47]QEL01938.1 PLP-dependent aminotransferase family protein [Olivibacter sp. LS-1]